MLLTVVLLGLSFMIGAAVVIGVEAGSRDSGWAGIASGRRELAELGRRLDERAEALAAEGRELWEWEGRLIAAAESGGCPACELRRRRGDRPAS